MENCFKDRGRRGSRERLFPGRHFVEHDAQRKKIGARVERLAKRLLGRHIGNRAHGRARHGEIQIILRGLRRESRRRLADHFGQPEVEHFRVAPLGHKNIRRLYVAMNDALCMRGLKCVSDLGCEPQQAFGVERFPTDSMAQRDAVEKFHRHKGAPLFLADIVQGANIRVIERRRRLRFTAKTGKRLRIGSYFGGKKLESDETP